MAATAATLSSAVPATTRCSAAPGTTSSSAVPVRISSTAAPETTHSSNSGLRGSPLCAAAPEQPSIEQETVMKLSTRLVVGLTAATLSLTGADAASADALTQKLIVPGSQLFGFSVA